LALGLAAVVVSMGLGLLAGPDGFSLSMLTDQDAREMALSLRAGRVWLAVVVGAALASTGAALQALLRNPLADPYVTGVSGGAAVGGCVAVAVGGVFASFGLPLATSIGALAASLIVAWFVAHDEARSETALLVGIVVNAFAWALLAVVRTMLPAARTQILQFWLVGTVGYPSGVELLVATIVLVVGLALLMRQAGALGLLAASEDEARRLGISTRRAKALTYVAASLLVGVAVATTGIIGFVGLIVPHAVRLRFGVDERLLLPASALFGAATLALFDATARASFIVFETELPVGALTAVVGAPVFGVTLWRRARRGRG
jgi:iron complex transport system permease protein